MAVILRVAPGRSRARITMRVTLSGEVLPEGNGDAGQNTVCIIGEGLENVCLGGDPISQGTRQRMAVENLKKRLCRQRYLPGVLSGPPEVLHILSPCCSLLAFQYSGMGSFGFLLSSYQKLPPFCFSSPHIGNVLVTMDEMQTAEFWQLSDCRCSGNFPSVVRMAFPLS